MKNISFWRHAKADVMLVSKKSIFSTCAAARQQVCINEANAFIHFCRCAKMLVERGTAGGRSGCDAMAAAESGSRPGACSWQAWHCRAALGSRVPQKGRCGPARIDPLPADGAEQCFSSPKVWKGSQLRSQILHSCTQNGLERKQRKQSEPQQEFSTRADYDPKELEEAWQFPCELNPLFMPAVLPTQLRPPCS